jgi:hypothetical protein
MILGDFFSEAANPAQQAAIAIAMKKAGKKPKTEDQIAEACWKGYHKEGMKTMFGKRYPNCVKNKKKNEDVAEGSEQKPVIVYTNHRGATIDDGIKKSLPVTELPANKLQMWEKHKSMKDPKIANWVTNKLLPELKQNGVLKPLLVWNNDGEFFVIDGNHRFIAYQVAGYQGRVPVQIVPDNMVNISDTLPGQQGVAENFADGKNPGRKGLAKRSGINTKASVSSLRKTAKHSSGEKQRMAHWLANMKAGRAKAKKK